MQRNIYLTPDGVKALAKGEDVNNPYCTWYFVQDAVANERGPEYIKVAGPIECTLPSRDECIDPAVRKLQEQLKEVRAEAYKAERELEQEINDLLALEYTPSQEVE